MCPTNTFSAEDLIVARITEFLDVDSVWNRSLWQVGTVLSIREVVESAQSTWAGALRPEALDDFARNALRTIAADKSVASLLDLLQTSLREAASKKPDESRPAVVTLEELARRIENNYLWNWFNLLSASPPLHEDIEIVSRLVASHLLDLGFSREHLRRWIEKRRGEAKTLGDLLREAQVMQRKGHQSYEFVVGFSEIPDTALEAFGEDAIPAAQFETLYEECDNSINSGAIEGVQAGARIRTVARDPFAALEIARHWLKRYETRVRIGSTQQLAYDPRVIDVEAKKIRRLPDGALLRIPSIANHLVFASDATNGTVLSQIDDALALLAPHLQTTPGVSVASLWAAAEGLLGSVETSGASVATRLAEIVACSFARDEIHHLAFHWHQHGAGALHEELRAIHNPSFAHKVRNAFAESLRTNGDPGFTDPRDAAAALRIRSLLADEATVIRAIRDYLDSTFRRLYYQRNFIMHAARFDSVSLTRATEICPTLVAAGLNQVIMAQSGETTVSPAALASRARNEISLLGTDGAKPVFSMLAP